MDVQGGSLDYDRGLGMTLYELRFAPDGAGEGKRIEFKALDASDALVIAHREAAHRLVELWEGSQMLCTIRRAAVGSDEFWEVGGTNESSRNLNKQISSAARDDSDQTANKPDDRLEPHIKGSGENLDDHVADSLKISAQSMRLLQNLDQGTLNPYQPNQTSEAYLQKLK